MARSDIDAYLGGVAEPGRSTLERLREQVLAVVGDAEETISYGVPAFRVGGQVVAGFSASRGHLTYLPHSGTVLTTLADRVSGYACGKGSLRFALDTPLPDDLVEALVAARLAELGTRP